MTQVKEGDAVRIHHTGTRAPGLARRAAFWRLPISFPVIPAMR